jgi:hypothetical protein
MNRWLRNLVRPTALMAAVLYAFAPAVLLANCNCRDCACVVAEESGGACCCVQPRHNHAHELAACCQKSSVEHCGSHATPAESEIQGCTCDSHLSSQPVSEQPKRFHDSDRTVSAASLITLSFLPAIQANDSLSPLEVAPTSIVSPPPRILFCVWRN